MDGQMIDYFENIEENTNSNTTATGYISSKDSKSTAIGRLALSKNICRFELPMDMRQFEDLKMDIIKLIEAEMTPTAYLEKYCRVNDRRKNLYRKVFDKYKIKSEGKDDHVDIRKFEDCLMDVHMKSINRNQILNLACVNPIQPITFPLFVGLAALSERVLYDHFVTEDTIDLPEYQKDKVECADFGSLNTKLEGVKIGEKMLNLLKSL